MLTELFSNNEEKCVQYWPVPINEWITYESIKVCKTEETEHFQGLHVTKRQFWVLKDVSTPYSSSITVPWTLWDGKVNTF